MAVAPQPSLRARSVDDAAEIGAFLRRDRLYAAYALGDLEPTVRRGRATWGMAYDELERPVALGMHYDGLVPQPVFLMGDAEGCRQVLAEVLRPREAFFMARSDHQSAMAAYYDLEAPSEMLRMAVDRHTFRPVAGGVERLRAGDVEQLNRLYQLGFRGGFPASTVEEGVYYGVRVRGRLVAAAGTHVVSRRQGIGVVGNVMTHADHRGQGYAKMVTSAVTAELLESVTDVALNVHADNLPAIAAYRRLGYREHCRLLERLGRRRSGGWGFIRPLREAIRLTWPRD